MAFGSLIGAIGGGILGGIAGSEDQKQTQKNVQRVSLDDADALERQGASVTGNQLSELNNLVSAGPGMAAVEGSNQANAQLDALLGNFAQGGFLPGQQDISAANQFASNIFAPQQQMLNNQFEDARTEQARLAAQLGRPINDPVLQNKLMQTQAREQANLGAQQTAFAAQQAQQMPLQRLGFTQDLAGLRSGLATQAMANRQALLGLGNQIQQQGRQFRLNTATRSSNTSQIQHANMGTMIGGALAGAGFGMRAGKMLGGLSTGTVEGGSPQGGPIAF